MIEEETINLYDAIKEMRKLSSQGDTFSFVHSTWNRDTDTSNGLRHVNRARLRPAAKGEDFANSDHKLFYFDEEINEPRNCWQILIMSFNGKKIVLN